MQSIMMPNITASYEIEKVPKDWERLSFLPLPIIAFCINFFLFMTTTMNRKKLERQNYVYFCVISILLSNVLYILLHVWYTFDTLFGVFDRNESKAKIAWTLYQAAIVSIQPIMAGNIGSLLFVVLDSTYFVGRSVNRKATELAKEYICDQEHHGKRQWSLKTKRGRAFFLILISWIVPVSLVVAATAKWNCDDKCNFSSHGFDTVLNCTETTSCSRIWQPLHKDYLTLHAVLWVFQALGLLFLIVSGIRQFHQVMAPPQRDSSAAGSLDGRSRDSMVTESTIHSIDKRSQKSRISVESPNTNSIFNGMEMVSEDSVRYSKTTVTDNESGRFRQRKHRSLFRLHSRISFMIVLSFTFIACSFPSFITYILDVADVAMHYDAAMNVSFIMIYIYVIFCPIIILKYLPNLKSALIMMTRRCACSQMPRFARRRSFSKKLRISQNPK